MEHPQGRLDDLQPQDLSASGIPAVVDRTRNSEECVANAASLDALTKVKSPGWYPNSGSSDPGLPFSETDSSDITLQSGDQVQPDNAFSHTTVTLSYVSRSHIFSTQDSLSRRSPRYGVPSVNKLSLHPPCDSDEGLGETGYALNQHYLEQVDGPVDLATQTELFQSQAQVGPEKNGGVCQTQKPQEFNSGVVSGGGDADNREQGQVKHSLSRENGGVSENGQGDSWSSSGVCAESSPETHTAGEDEERGGPEVLFLMSKKPDPIVVPDGVGPRDLRSLSRDYISPLEDPVSPSATSQDDVDDVFVLPQASSSPSGDNSYLETTDEVAPDGPSTEGPIETGTGTSGSATTLDSSSGKKQPVHKRKAVLEPLIDLTDDVCLSEVSENKSKTVVPHMNGNAKALQRTIKERKLPMRSGRGTRLEAIVMNINSGRYKVSGCIRANKKAKASQSTGKDSKLAATKRKDTQSVGKRTSRAKASFSAKTMKQKAVSPVKRGKTNNINTDMCKDSTSDSEINKSKKSHGITSPKSPQLPVHKNSKEPELPSHPGPLVETPEARFSPPPPPSSPPPESKSPKKSQGKAKGKAAGGDTSPAAKAKRVRTPKSRRKKRQQSRSCSMFSPKEPEIKLRYVNYKEEKRDLRLDGFSPFIRVQRRQLKPSLCTVINYPEEVRTQHKKGQQAHPGGFISAVVPSTSCLQLGRPSMHSQHQRSLVCCLCGQSANAMDLGDLHGPYYPEGYQPSTKTPASMSGLKGDEDDFSDSSSSSCSVRGRRGRKGAVPPHLKEQGLLGSHRWACGDGAGSPAAKRARLAAGSANVEDWYSPPVLPLEPCEYWLHEDCGIWSAGIFLVKGKVYGLEEAVKVAQETMCSACRDPGATLGCFFKGCPNKYHYRCALESDCVLIEENFSMKCKKHKNKTFKAPPGNRWDDR